MSRRRLGSIREIRPGVWRIELTHGRDPLTGERRRMSRTVHGSEQEAERELARMLLEIGELPAGGRLTVEEYLRELWIPWIEKRVRRSTFTGYEAKLEAHVIPILGHLTLGELEPYTLDRWRDELVEKMSGRSALHVYRVLNTALVRAVKWKRIRHNPLEAVDAPRASVRDLDTLSADEARKYLEAFADHELGPLVTLAVSTGLRPCELAALEWRDLDLKNGTVRVWRGLHERKSETWFEEPKSERSHRVVTLPGWVVEYLKTRRGVGPVTPGDGEPMRPTAIGRAYRRRVTQAKLRYVPIRDLRHTHATLMLEAGVDLVVVSRRLGHGNVWITDRHYLRPKSAADQNAADRFGDFMSGNVRQATAGDTTEVEDGRR